MPGLPTGTVTFLFTDLERSTERLRMLGDTRYAALLADHHRLLREAISAHHGTEVDTQGESFFVAFPTAADAVAAAIAIQQAVSAHEGPGGEMPRVRMGIHTGEPTLTATGYVGMDVHRASRICNAGYGGQVLLSQTTASLIRHDLPPGASLVSLGEHRLKDLQRPEYIFQLAHPALRRDYPALRSLGATPNNLPVQLTSFIGRGQQIGEIRSLLDTGRLLTLTGPGGCGKTRLALQVAAELLDRFPHGVWLVELAPLSDPALVPRAVAADLGLRQEFADMTAALAEHLRSLNAMLILDGCEHLLGACAHLSEVLLRAARDLRILATSRQRLGVAGEMVYVVPSLSLPNGAPVESLEELQSSEAARLFVERALLSRPDFSPTNMLAPAIAQVVQRLDGIPLAIELAAARVKVLTVDQIARRLDDRFRLLTGGTRGLLRQQTLEATIDWSIDLLSDEEKILLRRLAVFAGRFSLKAVEAVCAGGSIAAADVLDLLSLLIDKSLVLAKEHAGEMRYRLLETVREYNRAKLAASREWDGLKDAHLGFFLTMAEEAEPEVRGAHSQTWLERLEAEHDNLRAALAWAHADPQRSEQLLRLASALWYFWFERGHWTEGREWLDKILAVYQGMPTAPYVKAIAGASALAWRQADHDRAAELAENSRALSAALGDRWGLAFSLLNLGIVARRRDDYERAAALHEESLRLFRNLEDEWGTAWSLRLLGIVRWYQGAYARARANFEEALRLYRSSGNRRGIADALHGLARTAAYEGKVDAALPLLTESLDVYQRLGSPAGVALTQYVLGKVGLQQGEPGRAKDLLDSSLELFRRGRDVLNIAATLTLLASAEMALGDYRSAADRFREGLGLYGRLGYDWHRWGMAELLEAVAGLAIAKERPETAVTLLAAAATIRTRIKAPIPAIDRPGHLQQMEALRSAVSEHTFQEAWKRGEDLPPEQVLSSALADLNAT